MGELDHVCRLGCTGRDDGGVDWVICPICERDDAECSYCGGRGLIRLEGCPNAQVTADVWELVAAADLIKTSGWPNGRGWANEPAALVEGVRRVWSELDRIKFERLKQA